MRERKFYFLLNLIWIGAFPASLLLHSYWPALIALLTWIPLFDRSRYAPFLPSLMYHCVSDNYHRFPKSHLCVSLRNFRWAMAWLKIRKYRTLSFAEAEAFTQGKIPDRRCVHLTFDDGYLDNWVNAFPVLQQHGFKGTVFVTTEFIQRSSLVRPVRPLQATTQEFEEWGFMTEAEIVAADKTGVLEFLPHGRTHTWLEKSDELLGFHLPGDRQVWLDWNLKPEEKANWIVDFPQGYAGAGWPILAFGKSLEVRAFLVDQDKLRVFQQKALTAKLTADKEGMLKLWADFRKHHPVIGRMETDEEFEARIRDELGSCKYYLEELLKKPCNYFCWPGGGKQAFSLQVAYEELGYRMTTTHQYDTPNRRGVPNRWLYRIAPGYSLRLENPLWNFLRFVSQLETTRRNYCWITLYVLGHAVEELMQRMGRRRRKQDHAPLQTYGIPVKK